MSNPTSVWYNIINDKKKSWVEFENGTCVVLMNPESDLAQQAKDILAENGIVHAGPSFGDFSVMKLDDFPGWIVFGHHPDILNYVAEDAFEDNPSPMEVMVGLLGRQNRDTDAHELKVVHVNDQRAS